MPSRDQPQQLEPPRAIGSAGCAPLDQDDVYELQDHEFVLEPDDTLELPTGPAHVALPSPVSEAPPLPRWAAASRSLLDDFSALEAADAQTTLETSVRAARSIQATEGSARDKLARLARQLHAREVYVHEVERALATASGRVRGQAFRIAELEAALREAVAARPVAAGGPDPVAHDDLKRIKGIGPSFEKRLHASGVTTYAAIAAWRAAELGAWAERLGVSRERIAREAWVKQARALCSPRRRRKP